MTGRIPTSVVDELARRKAPLIEWLEPRVRELYLQDGERPPELAASSFLVRAGSERFLVTADHVRKRLEHGQRLLLATSEELVQVAPTSLAAMANWKRDVLVVHLPPESEGWSVEWFDWRYLAVDHPDERWPYCAFGFPWRAGTVDREGARVGAKGSRYFALEAEEATYRKYGFDRNTHLLLNFNRKQSRSESGEIQAVKMPHGMSGGVVVVAGTYLNPPFDPSKCGVFGVLVEFRDGKTGVLAAARTRVVIAMINDLRKTA